MKEKEICQYCEKEAKFNDIGLNEKIEYSVVGVCARHLTEYGTA
jgi:superfamily II helicase